MSKKKRKLCVFIGVVGICMWLYWGNHAIQTTTITVAVNEASQGLQGFTIVQVSDVHNASFGSQQHKLIDRIKKESPDIIAITGDLIDSSHTDVDAAMTLIRGLTDLAPIYFITGNHEAWTHQYADLKQQLLEAGVFILEDTDTIIEVNDVSIQLIGLSDPDFTGGLDVIEREGFLSRKLEQLIETKHDYSIVLSHRPEFFDVYASSGVDLVLTGHAHGGQVRLPFLGGLVAPNQGMFPDYSEGVYERDKTRMVVSRGLGNSIIPLRINNRPELVVVRLGS